MMANLPYIQLRKQGFPFLIGRPDVKDIVEQIDCILNTGIGVKRNGAVWDGIGRAADTQQQCRRGGQSKKTAPPM